MYYSYDEIKDVVESFGCELLSKTYGGEYSTNIEVKYTCGHIGTPLIRHFIDSTHLCFDCSIQHHKLRHSYEYVKEYIENLNCKLLSKEYNGGNKSLEILYDCGHNYTTTFDIFKKIKKSICPNCSFKSAGINHRSNSVDIQEYFFSHGFEIIGEKYTTAKQKLLFQDQYGYKYYLNYDVFKKDMENNCSPAIFSSYNPYTIENIILWTKLNDSPFIFIDGKYKKNSERNLIFKCSHCLNNFTTCWQYVQIGINCPICNMSKGERKIKIFLDNRNIEYKMQQFFPECKLIKMLPFDFYLSEYNICIEYQGEQHFKQIPLFGGEKQLKLQKERDGSKKKYCQDNNIVFIEIPYWDYKNIEEILNQIIKYELARLKYI